MKSLKLYLISGITFSLVIIITALTVARERSSTSGRASSGNSLFSSFISRENSYIFASPISAPADGESVIRITVFLLNSQGMGVAGQKVMLKTIPNITITTVNELTDSVGKATFDLTSSTPGDYTINASVSNVSLLQQVSISFH